MTWFNGPLGLTDEGTPVSRRVPNATNMLKRLFHMDTAGYCSLMFFIRQKQSKGFNLIFCGKKPPRVMKSQVCTQYFTCLFPAAFYFSIFRQCLEIRPDIKECSRTARKERERHRFRVCRSERQLFYLPYGPSDLSSDSLSGYAP